MGSLLADRQNHARSRRLRQVRHFVGVSSAVARHRGWLFRRGGVRAAGIRPPLRDARNRGAVRRHVRSSEETLAGENDPNDGGSDSHGERCSGRKDGFIVVFDEQSHQYREHARESDEELALGGHADDVRRQFGIYGHRENVSFVNLDQSGKNAISSHRLYSRDRVFHDHPDSNRSHCDRSRRVASRFP